MTTDAEILTALRSANEGGVSGAELSNELGISRAAIWARIEELRQVGYDIEATPHLGYRLVSSPDALHADDLLLNPNAPLCHSAHVDIVEYNACRHVKPNRLEPHLEPAEIQFTTCPRVMPP